MESHSPHMPAGLLRIPSRIYEGHIDIKCHATHYSQYGFRSANSIKGNNTRPIHLVRRFPALAFQGKNKSLCTCRKQTRRIRN